MTLKEIGKEMLKARNLSTIIDKKKEEFDELFESFIEYPVNDRPILAPCEYEDIIKMKNTEKSFLEKAIRESVDEALLAVRPEEYNHFDVVTGFENKVKEFMK